MTHGLTVATAANPRDIIYVGNQQRTPLYIGLPDAPRSAHVQVIWRETPARIVPEPRSSAGVRECLPKESCSTQS